MLRLRALVILAFFCVLSADLTAQAPGTGLYPFGSFDSRGFDSINNGNLNVHFEIPIVSKPGRGQGFQYSLVYDGLIWSPSSSSGVSQWVPDSGWGFHGQLNGAISEAFVGYSANDQELKKCFLDPPGWYWAVTTSNYVYYDSFGQQHWFNYATDECTGTTTGDGSSNDGSGYRFGGAVFNRYGSEIIAPANGNSTPGSITDANGNVISNNNDGTFTDTLGVTALAITGGGNASSPRVLTYKVANQADGSTTAAATVSYVTYTVETNFGCSVSETGPNSIDLVDRITLADGSYYQFSYEPTPGGASGAVTGRLASVTLPTGGTISYSYSGGCNGNGLNADGTVGGLTRSTSDGTRTYSRGPASNGSTTDLQDESGNHTYYTFVDVGGTHYETHRQVYQGPVSGTPLLDQQTCYNNSVPCDGVPFTLQVNTLTVAASLNGGPQTRVVNSYYGGTQLLASTQSDDSNSNVLQGTYYVYNGTGRPTSVVVKDGPGNILAQNTYGYDEQVPTTTSNIPQHNAASGSNGNQTSSHTWINTGGSIDTATTYYDTGVPINSTGPTGTTTYTFDATQGFMTQVTPPTPSSGVSLPSYASYEVNSGIPLSASDANNPGSPHIQYAQYDKLLRPKQINTIDGGSTNYSYTTIPGQYQIGVSTTLNNSTNADTETLYDNYGRVSRVGVFNGQAGNAWYETDYCYGPTGRLQFQSLPFQNNGGWGAPKRCSGSGASYIYDALGRVTSITNPDGTAYLQYNGRAVKTTDVNGVQVITEYDLLGRISTVCEVSNSTLQGDLHQDCGLDIGGTGFLTNYSYDPLNHKTTIYQGVQTRIFQTDSVGRTISTTEPERGVTTYSYTYSGASPCSSVGLCVTRTRPRANQTNPSVTTTSTTQYDAIGRPVSITYNDGTQPYGWWYDSPQNWPDFTQNNLKGRMSEASRYIGSSWAAELFTYDSMGRISGMNECLPSACGNMAYDKQLPYTHDFAGNLTSAGDGAGRTTSYTYSSASEVTSISSSLSGPTYPSALISNVQNTPAGPQSYYFGNGLSQWNVYDSLNRLAGGWVCIGAPAGACSLQAYGFYATWNGSRLVNSGDDVMGFPTTYGYDEFNRLTSTSYNNGNDFAYAYDRYGNRWSQTVTHGTGPSPSPSFHKASNQIVGYTYDAAGNMIYDGTYTYTYDPEGNITQVNNGSTVIAAYSYNSLNQRVRVDQGSTATEYVFNASGQRVSTWDGHSLAQIQGQSYWGSRPIAFYSGGSLHFQHQDWMGTERVRTSYNGSTEGYYTSLPWGDGYVSSGSDNDPYHFATLDHDSETDTHHAQFRQYSSTQGRWMSPDPYSGSYSFGDPQSFNRYTYVRNNPLAAVDPSGMMMNLNVDDPGMGVQAQQADAAAWNADSFFNDIVGPGEGRYKNLLDSPYANPDSWVYTNQESRQATQEGEVITVNCNDDLFDLDCALAPWSARYVYNPADHYLTGNARIRALAQGVNSQAGVMGTFTGVGAFYGASLLGAAPSVAASLTELPTMTVVVGEGSPFHVAFGTEGTWLHATGDFFEMTIGSDSAAAYVRAYEYFRFSVPVLNPGAVLGTAGAAASTCVTGACYGLWSGWIK